MKKLFFILSLSITLLSCGKHGIFGDDHLSASQVPNAVQDSFAVNFPKAGGEIEWEREDGNTFKVKFFIGTARWEAIFAADGHLISEKLIEAGQDIPQAVLNAFNSQFPDATEAKWQLKDGNWKVEFKRAGSKWEAIFASDGKLLKLEKN